METSLFFMHKTNIDKNTRGGYYIDKYRFGRNDIMNNFITSLFFFMNNPEVRDTNYQIAYGLLKYGHQIGNMTVQQLADKCYVSVSTLNRFLKIYGFQKYHIFKSYYSSHIMIRKKQMINRLNKKDNKQLEKAFSAFLTHDEITTLMNQTLIHQCCQYIQQSKRILLIGSDEMIVSALRMQSDFYVMNKLMIKDSIYKDNFFVPNKDDFIILLSMAGKIVDSNKLLIQQILEKGSQILTIGHFNYLEGKTIHLSIPQHLDEVLENMILDYYLQEITYTYMRDYYDY